MSSRRNTPFSLLKPPPLDVPEAPLSPLENPPPLPPPSQNPPVLQPPPQNPPTEYLIKNEEPEDEYVSNDQWAIDDNVDEETLTRLMNYDPWEDERNTDSDVSFDSIFND
ncbi:hypothetical protein E3N88_25377 [Mikania micrantha]|uniref:Uncharacterized protein n=1 Tax=Mikania micrantha TaxID=192012 RepID=A0A5N6N4K3_9ASTR|nr:hypothetical protein E3N88_25377 [Mikania micrantha]